jgi:hypothetical protein
MNKKQRERALKEKKNGLPKGSAVCKKLQECYNR